MTERARKGIRLIASVGLTLSLCGIATAQDYPTKPIHFIVPSSPGGGADTVARVLANALPSVLGQEVVVENRSGAGGTIGAAVAADAEPDGYTWLLVGNAHAANETLYDNLSYGLLEDFDAVTQTNSSPHVIVVRPSLDVESVEDLIAMAKEKPGELNYASAGSGSVTFLAAEIFKDEADVDITHIPYDGGGASLGSILAGETDIYFSPLLVALEHIEGGTLRPLAVTSGARVDQLPDVPTVAESGVPGYEFNLWNGIVVPDGTPEETIDRIREAVIAASETPEASKSLTEMGSTIVGSTPAEFGTFLEAQVNSLGKLVKELDLKVQ